MRKIIYCLGLLIGLAACSVKPEPIIFGKDSCYTCKMTLMDNKFGGEVVTKKGKVYKFDDANCMIGFINSSYVKNEHIAYKLVIDFSNPETLIDAETAFFVKSAEIKSPMASQVAAFQMKEKMEQYNASWNGIYLTWGELITQFK